MYKDEMIQLHQFLVYVLKYLAEDDQITNDCSEYITLKISPHHIHKTKAEHKHAIFVLCKIISQVIADKEGNSIPEHVLKKNLMWLKSLLFLLFLNIFK